MGLITSRQEPRRTPQSLSATYGIYQFRILSDATMPVTLQLHLQVYYQGFDWAKLRAKNK